MLERNAYETSHEQLHACVCEDLTTLRMQHNWNK